MDPLSKTQEEIRQSDDAEFEREKRVFADIAAIVNSPGFLEFEKMLVKDQKEWLSFATSDICDSVLNPMPQRAIGTYNYIEGLLNRIGRYREAK